MPQPKEWTPLRLHSPETSRPIRFDVTLKVTEPCDIRLVVYTDEEWSDLTTQAMTLIRHAYALPGGGVLAVASPG
jgi:hypothetical protein